MERKNELMENYRKVNALTRRKFREKRMGNFPTTQNRILMVLSNSDGISQRELSYILGIRPQSCSEILAKMEENELIVRMLDEDDARKYNVFLTEAGTAAAEDVKNAPQDSVFDVLSDEEKEALNALLAKVIALNPELTECDEKPMGKGPHHPHRRNGPPHRFLRYSH